MSSETIYAAPFNNPPAPVTKADSFDFIQVLDWQSSHHRFWYSVGLKVQYRQRQRLLAKTTTAEISFSEFES